MLNVPIAVKRALKEGTYKKNYRINVLKEIKVTTYTDVTRILTSYTVTEGAHYRLYNATERTYFEYVITKPNGDVISGYSPLPSTSYTELDVGFLDKDTVITLSDWVYPLYLQIVDGPNAETVTDFTIDNDTLVAESVTIDERMATGSELKFGLCEGSSLEFQYFINDKGAWELYTRYYLDDIVTYQGKWWKSKQNYNRMTPPSESGYWTEFFPNINGRQLQVFIDVEYGEDDPYSIPMGFFTVKSCSMQFSTGIYKATCYNKLQSDYLDAKANALLEEDVVDDTIPVSMYSIRDTLLKQFEIEPYEYVSQGAAYGYYTRNTRLSNSVKLSAMYDDSGPINYWDMVDKASAQGIALGTNTTLTISIESVMTMFQVYETDDGYYRFMGDAHDYGKLEELFVNYLKDFLDSCPLTKTGTQLIDEIKTLDLGWASLFGIYIPNTNPYRSYNDYAYKYQNDGTYKVTGAVSDILKYLFSKDDVPSGDNVIQIYYTVPSSINVWASLSSSTVVLIDSFNILGTGVIEYKGMNDTTKTYPKFHYEDGNAIPDLIKDPFKDWFGFYKVNGLTSADLIEVAPSSMSDFTLRDITSAVYETQCQFGQLDRETDLFSGVELNGGGLYPAETLYPANSLYPNNGIGGKGFHPYPSEYSKLWTDTQGEQTFRYLYITYKTLDGDNNEVEAVLQRTVNADGTTDYNMSDNWLFRNLIWTAEDVGDYADAMVTKMQGIKWFPFEMWAAGLPYVETGDAIEITDRNGGSHVSYVLQRQLQGIQNLQDTYVNGELDIF